MDALLFAGIAFCAVTFAYLCYIVSISGVRDANLAIFILPCAGIVLLAFPLRCQEETKVNLVLSGLSIGACVYLVEFYLAFSKVRIDLEYLEELADEVGAPFDARTKLQVLEALRGEGIDAYPTIIPGLFVESEGLESVEGQRLFPLAGMAGKTSVYCNENGPWITYQSDEHGFRNPLGSHNGVAIDIIMLGDSFTQGACVESDEEMAAILRRAGFGVLNLGHSGSSLQIALATFKEYAEPAGISGRTVLFFFFEGNDLEELIAHSRSPTLRKYLYSADFSQNLVERQEEVNRSIVAYLEEAMRLEKAERAAKDNYWYESRLAMAIKLSHLRQRLGIGLIAIDDAEPETPPPLDLFEQNRAALRDRIHAAGGQFRLVYLPNWSRYGAPSSERGGRYRREVLAVVEKLNIPVIDVHEAFVRHPDSLSLFPFRVEGHYNATGYAVAAAEILNHLGPAYRSYEAH